MRAHAHTRARTHARTRAHNKRKRTNTHVVLRTGGLVCLELRFGKVIKLLIVGQLRLVLAHKQQIVLQGRAIEA